MGTPLRDAGLDDRAILEVVEVTAYFNYVNRVADGPGVTLELAGQPLRPPKVRHAGHRGDGGERTSVAEGTVPPPPAPAGPGVRFTVFHPRETVAERWTPLLVYIHTPGAEPDVLADSRARLADRQEPYGRPTATATSAIGRGAATRVEPELPGFQFNPPHLEVLWLEDWHRAEFRMQATPGSPGFAPGSAVSGRVAFFVGPLLVGEVPIGTFLGTAEPVPVKAEPAVATASPYRRIFPSYSHQDADIVDALKAAYRAIGDEFLQDIDTLRSGQLWDPTLLQKIDEADVFQLFWSDAASHSEYVRQEYEHALARGTRNFVRPLYWKKPLGDVPPELGGIHFHYLDPAQIH